MQMITAVDTSDLRLFSHQDLDGLPVSVQRYFRRTLREGQPLIRQVAIKQRGFMRLRENSPKRQPFTATQLVTTAPVGFSWRAQIKVAPLLRVQVVDRYQDSKGLLEAKLFGVVTLAHAHDSRELNSGELQRYLAEAVWFPTALLPSADLRWQSLGEGSARATLRDGDCEVRVTFFFNGRDEIVRAETDRFRQVGNRYRLEKWSAHYSNYQRRQEIRIPLTGSVAWEQPQGNFEYWRGDIEDIQYAL